MWNSINCECVLTTLSAHSHEVIDELLEKEDDEAIRITGFQGSSTEAIGDIPHHTKQLYSWSQ